MSYKKPTIEEEGGLQVHLEKEGIDFNLFVQLHKAAVSNRGIGRALKRDGRTIGKWRSILKQEHDHA